jgi:ribose/xylose/arabinose/galactoside ABC-type transport system permease subunit
MKLVTGAPRLEGRRAEPARSSRQSDLNSRLGREYLSSVSQKSLPNRPLSWSPRSAIRRYGVYCSLALLLLIALVVRPEVYRPESLFLILRSASQLGMVALGQTLAMLVAGLDLSVTGLLVLTSVVIAQVGAGQDSRILPGLLISLGFGASIGLANGLLITKRNVPPFVATLGMLVLIRGAQSAYTQGIPSGQVPNRLKVLNQSLGPVSFVIWIAFTALLAFVLYATPFGRRIYAIGSNREAARLSGIAVDQYVIAIYIACSLLVVGSGIILSGYVGYVDRYLGRGFDLDSIAAAVVGGVAFSGGRGSLVAAMAGVLLVQFLSSLLLIIGMDVQAQLIVKGLVVIGAVALYSLAERRS